jgi:NAD(P)-dependent dehydrogenase (short-subunit alcohol dehydrogenase family)
VHIEFSQRRMIVAGAARGIGRAIAQNFAERGAEVSGRGGSGMDPEQPDHGRKE